MKAIYNHLLKKAVALFTFLILTVSVAFSANRVTVDISNTAEITTLTSDRYLPLTTTNISLTLEWRNVPLTAEQLKSLLSNTLSSYGVTVSAYVPNTKIAQISLRCSSSVTKSLEIVFLDYAGTKTIHWLCEEDMMTISANWIQERVYTGTGSSDYYNDIAYYNGLGLPEMYISGAASGNGNSIITPMVYDECMRSDTKQLLPFETTDASLVKVTGAAEDTAYQELYGTDAEYAFTTNIYDCYSLGRLTSSVMPGAIGRDRTKSSIVRYEHSIAGDKVLNIQYDALSSAISVSDSPVYLSGLSKTVYKDEDDKIVIKFTDNLGREVLSRQLDGLNENEGLDTYTVYDGAGRLVWVISPEGSELLEAGATYETSSTFACDWCTLYKYDSYGRMIERKLPGRGVEYYVYDDGDRLLLYQDGNLRSSGNKWIYRVYDSHGREIEKTIVVPVNSSMSVQQIRNLVSGSQYTYPDLCGVEDYRLPVSRLVFASEKQLSSVRYGGQPYRSSVSDATDVSTFTVPSDLYFAVVPGVVLSSDRNTETTNLKVYEKIWLLGDTSDINAANNYVERAFYYDVFGRVIQTVERDPWGKISRTSVKYDRQGNVLASKETRYLPLSSSSIVKMTAGTYDSRGRILTDTTTVSGTAIGSSAVSANVEYSYDGLGRLKSIATGNGVVTSREYTTQGWIDSLVAVDSAGSHIFSQSIDYQNCGLISDVTSCQGTSDSLSFKVSYDGAGRMTDWKQESSNAFAEKDITYDGNGNVLTLKRYGQDSAIRDDYSYLYAGNRLTRLNNGTVSTSPFTYDSNGNMISDVRNGISSISYNELNLPEEINNGRMSYVYLSDGTKLAALKDGVGYVYVGSMVFSCDFSATTPQLDFESTGFSAGRFVKNDSSVESEYHVNDYLCSVRVVTDAEGEVLERNDYSGFGKRLASSSGTQNRYRFIGKEDQSTLGLPWQDFGARMYDPDLARWTSPDPLSEHYPGISPYAYCNGDPVNLVDPDGKAWGKAIKVVKKIHKASKAGKKVSVKGILSSEAFDLVDNVTTVLDPDASLFEKGVSVFDLATGFGDELKWAAKTVGVSDAVIDGAKVIDGIKFKSFTRRNFRDNLGRLTGGIPEGMQAHHTLPYAFENKFSDIGINIHDPKYGVWLNSTLHNKLSQKYNKAWESFFKANSTYTEEQLMEYATKLMNEIYGQ